METQERVPRVWIVWLSSVCLGVVMFGLLLVLTPRLTMEGFSILVYGRASTLQSFGEPAAEYIALVHAVLGGVMVGWGVMMLGVTRHFLAEGHPHGWSLMFMSVLAWFVPDTAYSLSSGFWPNAVLNLVFFVLFAIPLARTHGSIMGGKP